MRQINIFPGLIFAISIIAVQPPALAMEKIDGKALFEINCAKCHGKDATASVFNNMLKPFPARNLRAIAAFIERDEFRRLITYGVHGTAMTPKKYTLDPLEIEAVIDYLQSMSYKPDIANGEKRFRTICAGCHGIDGRAKTRVGAKNLVYTKLDLKNIVHTMRYGRPGTAMTSKRHQMSNSDIVDVANYLFLNLRYRANPGEGKKMYAKNCLSCHENPRKIRLIGNIANPHMKIHEVSDTVLALRIRHGRHVDQAGKKVDQLSADDVQDIISYMRKVDL